MTLNLSISTSDLMHYINNLLSSNFPLPNKVYSIDRKCHDVALQRLEYCFQRINRKYYHDGNNPCFDPFNADHLCSYLWFLSNTIGYAFSDEMNAILLSHLNKRLHGVDLFYSVSMPDIFLLVHPVGSVFGSAKYSNYFVGYQNCTIGAEGSSYPFFEEGVICYSKTSVIGDCKVGENVVFGANSFVLNSIIPENTTVVGSYPNHRLLLNKLSVKDRIFSPISL